MIWKFEKEAVGSNKKRALIASWNTVSDKLLISVAKKKKQPHQNGKEQQNGLSKSTKLQSPEIKKISTPQQVNAPSSPVTDQLQKNQKQQVIGVLPKKWFRLKSFTGKVIENV